MLRGATWSAKRARTLLALGVAGAAALLVAACSSTPSASSPTGSTSTTATPTTASSTTTSSTTSSTTSVSTTTVTVPLETATSGEFYSPSKNISCEIDDTTSLQQVFCQTQSPPQSVTMKVDGTLTKCAGQQCLGNPGENTPSLPYGSATGTGPFRCLSTQQGMSCTVTSGSGFQIAAAGISVTGG
jgi:hypothetical protein